MLISNAFAQAAPAAAAPGFSLESLMQGPGFMFIIMIPLFYFLLIRPQQKRAKEQKTMMEAIKGGDEVITAGGVLGKVTKVAGQYVTLDVALAGNPVEMLVQKSSIQNVLPKGTIKSI